MLATYITHPSCHQHLMPNGHPECPERLDSINNQLLLSGLDALLQHRQAPEVTDAQLLRVHTAAHLQKISQAIPRDGIIFFDEDVYLSPNTLTAARHAAGAGVLAVDMVMAQQTDAVFCGVRPPGHHAERARAMGFCLFNNIAIAARHALDTYGLERVAIVDFDVHHGNGTQEIFSEDTRVLFCSSFQHPFYPNTEIEEVPDHILNVPLPASCRSEGFRSAVQPWFARIMDFKPQLIFISAGFDAYINDDISSVSLVEQDYFWISQQLRMIMDASKTNSPDEQCRGIVSMLEGGYDLDGLGRCVVAHIKALAKLGSV